MIDKEPLACRRVCYRCTAAPIDTCRPRLRCQALEREQAVCEAEARLAALQAQCSQQYLTLRAVHAELQERCVAARGRGLRRKQERLAACGSPWSLTGTDAHVSGGCRLRPCAACFVCRPQADCGAAGGAAAAASETAEGASKGSRGRGGS